MFFFLYWLSLFAKKLFKINLQIHLNEQLLRTHRSACCMCVWMTGMGLQNKCQHSRSLSLQTRFAMCRIYVGIQETTSHYQNFSVQQISFIGLTITVDSWTGCLEAPGRGGTWLHHPHIRSYKVYNNFKWNDLRFESPFKRLKNRRPGNKLCCTRLNGNGKS